MKKIKKSNTLKYFFLDSKISIILFIAYTITCVIILKADTKESIAWMSLIAFFSYMFSLVLPEYTDKKTKTKVSIILVWIFRIIFFLGFLYVLNDSFTPCGIFGCWAGLKGFVALLGLIAIPLVVMAVYWIVYWIIKIKEKHK